MLFKIPVSSVLQQSMPYVLFNAIAMTTLAKACLALTILYGGGVAVEYATRALSNVYQIRARDSLLLQSAILGIYHAAVCESCVALGATTVSGALSLFVPAATIFSGRLLLMSAFCDRNDSRVFKNPLPRNLEDIRIWDEFQRFVFQGKVAIE